MSTVTENETTLVACRVCGVGTTENTERRRTTAPGGRLPTPMNDYDVGTCSQCVTLDPDRPGLAVRAALRVLGLPEEDPLAADAFAEAGVDVAEVLYDRPDSPGTRGRTPQRKAFAHVDREGRAALRVGAAALLAKRVEKAADENGPTPPPEGGPPACLACGLATSAAWYGPVLTGSLTPGPGYVSGYMCDVCGPALDAEGAVGLPFLERAVRAVLDLDAPPRRLRAWVATGLEPRSAAWDWVEPGPPPVEELDPITALFEQVADLGEQVQALADVVAGLRDGLADLRQRVEALEQEARRG